MFIKAITNIIINELFCKKSRYYGKVHTNKKYLAIHYFSALSQACSKDHMIHWVMVGSQATSGRGINQITMISVANKNFCYKLSTALKNSVKSMIDVQQISNSLFNWRKCQAMTRTTTIVLLSSVFRQMTSLSYNAQSYCTFHCEA